MSRRLELIVFDWDGTLADSAGLIAGCIQRACADLGLPIPADEQARYVIGLGLHDALDHLVPGLPPLRQRELADRYRLHYLAGDAAIPLFAGAREALSTLRGAGFRLAVATGKSRRGLDRSIEQLGLTGCFDATRCADETAPKPDPLMLRELLDELAVPATGSLMVGDTVHDLDMAAAAGVDALAVSYGAHPRDALLRRPALGCLDRFDQLLGWIETNA